MVFSIITKMEVKAVKAGTKPATQPKMPLAMVDASSKASSTVVEGECPGMGASWISLTPLTWNAAILAAAADVKAAHGKFKPGVEGNYKN